MEKQQKRLQQDVHIYLVLILFSSISSFLHPFLRHPSHLPFKRQLQCLILHVPRELREHWLSQREKEWQNVDDPIGEQSRKRRRKGGKRNGEYKAAFIFSLPCKTKYDEKRAGDGVEVTDRLGRGEKWAIAGLMWFTQPKADGWYGRSA